MTRYYTRAEALALLHGLDEQRLDGFVAARIVRPATTASGPAFREVDLARLQLVSDLTDLYDLPDDAVELVMALIDQLNAMRGDMRALVQAVATEPDEVRLRLYGTIRSLR